jgi:hypothetical protein
MKIVKLPYNIQVNLDKPNASGRRGAGIMHNLREEADRSDTKAEARDKAYYNCRIAGLDSLILACASAGVDIESQSFREAVTSAIDAIGNIS